MSHDHRTGNRILKKVWDTIESFETDVTTIKSIFSEYGIRPTSNRLEYNLSESRIKNY